MLRLLFIIAALQVAQGQEATIALSSIPAIKAALVRIDERDFLQLAAIGVGPGGAVLSVTVDDSGRVTEILSNPCYTWNIQQLSCVGVISEGRKIALSGISFGRTDGLNYLKQSAPNVTVTTLESLQGNGK